MGGARIAPPGEVARALGEPPDGPDTFDVRSVPLVPPPVSTRPCCAFGMDLGITVGGKVVPGYAVPNVKSPVDLGPHTYDKGALALESDLARFATSENNGLVYTCRGGFFDTAHVRDYADLTLFLTLRFVLGLEHGIVLELPGDGAVRRIELRAASADVLAREGRWALASALAQWVAWQLSLWHEIVTWYGLESFKGFSERASAFSPEDLYSNVIGIRLATGILTTSGVRSRDDYERQLDAWVREALSRLRAVPEGLGRRAMRSLDGRWWDSNRTLPDVQLVRRRAFPAQVLTPWTLEGAHVPVDPVLASACTGTSVLPLTPPPRPAGELVTLRFEVGDWAPPEFPLLDAQHRVLTSEQLPAVIETVRAQMRTELGAEVDRP